MTAQELQAINYECLSMDDAADEEKEQKWL